jgi:hypothetical protein
MSDTAVKVILIEPGPITSKIRENAIPHFERWIDWQASPRADEYRARLLDRLYTSRGPDPFELPPSAVTEKLIRALEARHPRPRYYVTTPTFAAGFLKRVLSARAADAILRRS